MCSGFHHGHMKHCSLFFSNETQTERPQDQIYMATN